MIFKIQKLIRDNDKNHYSEFINSLDNIIIENNLVFLKTLIEKDYYFIILIKKYALFIRLADKSPSYYGHETEIFYRNGDLYLNYNKSKLPTKKISKNLELFLSIINER